MLNPITVTVPSFCVIGRVARVEKDSDTVHRLWEEARLHYAEVAPLAKKNQKGEPVGFWGAMSREDMSFLPWEDEFSRGLYSAGVEVGEDAVAPEGWKKWIVPGFECCKVRQEGPDTFREMLAWMDENGLSLKAAVQEFTDPATGHTFLLFPFAWNDSKASMIKRIKENTDPIAFCGLHCLHCFLSEWCGNCRSACNMCSYATLSDSNRCENEICCTEKGLDGCFACDALPDCGKGFYKEPAGVSAKAFALFIRRHGKETFSRVMKDAVIPETAAAGEILAILESSR